MIQKIVKICDSKDYPYVYNILFPLFTVLNIILSLIASGKCLTNKDPYTTFLVFIFLKSAIYIYELSFIYCGLIRQKEIGISNNVVYLQDSISKSEARVRKMQENMENKITHIKKEIDKFEEHEALYQNKRREQIAKIEEKERERIRKIEEKERERIGIIEEKERERIRKIEEVEREKIRIIEEEERDRFRIIEKVERERIRKIEEEERERFRIINEMRQSEINFQISIENKKLEDIRLETERAKRDLISGKEIRNNEDRRLREEKYKLEEEKDIINKTKAKLRENEEAIMKYHCPITLGIMEDPVVAADGRTYERAAISEWLENKDTSPSTGLPLNSTTLIPNIQLRNLILVHNRKMEGNK